MSYQILSEGNAMCGIVGAVGKQNVSSILLDGLKRLEYRGYDSAGMVVMDEAAKFHHHRTLGKVNQLEQALDNKPLDGLCGIAHTRWATHGKPDPVNAHPHFSGHEIAVVHNGIIENFEDHKDTLTKAGYEFHSQTDTEVIAHLIHQHVNKGLSMIDAMKQASMSLKGSYALGIMHYADPNTVYAIRQGSPLVIGLSEKGHFLASDPIALAAVAKDFIYLEEGDMAIINQTKVQVYDKDGQSITRPEQAISGILGAADKGAHRHFMAKEIFEQPEAIRATLDGRIDQSQILTRALGEQAQDLLANVKNIQIVACGTSYHAGLVAKYWFEALANVPTHVEVASEIRYRPHAVSPDTLFLTISQSGETADTLAALKQAQTKDYLATAGICNVAHSSLVRESDLVLLTRAGVEIGVASTKAFTTQLCVLLTLALATAKQKGLLAEDKESEYVTQLHKLPNLCEQMLTLDADIKTLAQAFTDKRHALFLGRGLHYPIAMEGALKLKEISYIHAESYPAGELKHGPLALVDKDMPVVAVAPNDSLLEKLKANLSEVQTRGGQLYVFADEATQMSSNGAKLIAMPSAHELLAPIAYTIPLQLLAYHVAVNKGTDVDQPRNLAKSVTVE